MIHSLIAALAICSVLCLGCCQTGQSLDEGTVQTGTASANVELKDNLDSGAFQKALVGSWSSVFSDKSRDFIRFLRIGTDGAASVTIQKRNGEQRSITGPYELSFVRPPSPGDVTLGNIAIVAPSGEKVVLTRVNFGLHNAVLMKEGPFLRIGGSPSGVLERVGN